MNKFKNVVISAATGVITGYVALYALIWVLDRRYS